MEADISKSILETIKKLIGIDKDYGVFDIDLVVAINSSFTILNQLGVGPFKSFSISGPSETWSDFFGEDESIDLAKSYIYLRARLLFDPPETGVLHEAIERQIKEFEWRLMIQAETKHMQEIDTKVIDHPSLANRDLPDQHPIDAITGLGREIERIPEVMSAEEMRNILLS